MRCFAIRYFIINTSAKNCQNLLIFVEVIAKQTVADLGRGRAGSGPSFERLTVTDAITVLYYGDAIASSKQVTATYQSLSIFKNVLQKRHEVTIKRLK